MLLGKAKGSSKNRLLPTEPEQRSRPTQNRFIRRLGGLHFPECGLSPRFEPTLPAPAGSPGRSVPTPPRELCVSPQAESTSCGLHSYPFLQSSIQSSAASAPGGESSRE